MTAPDPNKDSSGSAIEELVQLSEEMEARALRAELTAFMQSPEVRAELQLVVLKPLESMVAACLSDEKLHMALRAHLLNALKPDIASAAQAAAADAVKNVRVSIDQADEQRLTGAVDATIKRALADTQSALTRTLDAAVRNAYGAIRQQIENEAKQALSNPMALLPRDWSKGIANTIQAAASEAIESARVRAIQAQPLEANNAPLVSPPLNGPSRPIPENAPRTSSRFRLRIVWLEGMGVRAGIAILLLALSLVVFFYARSSLSPGVAKSARPSPDVAGTPLSGDDADRRKTESQVDVLPKWYSDLRTRYLDEVRSGGGSFMTAEQADSVNNAFDTAKPTTQRLDMAALRAALLEHPALSVPPPSGSPIVAVVQRALNQLGSSRTCADLRVSVDGKAGWQTTTALQSYLACNGDGSLPLLTLADYVAAGIYLVDKRHGIGSRR